MSYVLGRAPWYTHMQIHTHTCNSHTHTQTHLHTSTHPPIYNYTCISHFLQLLQFWVLQISIAARHLPEAIRCASIFVIPVCVCVYERVCVWGKVVTFPKFWQSCEMNFEWRRIISKWNLKRLPAATELLPSFSFSLCLYFPSPSLFPRSLCFRSIFNTFTSCIANKQVAKYMFPSKLIANWICNLFGFPPPLSFFSFVLPLCGFLLSLLFLYFFRYLSQIWNFNFHNRMNPSSLFVH